ncbi:MAG: hypothetical protein ABIC40_06010 [bacterium]
MRNSPNEKNLNFLIIVTAIIAGCFFRWAYLDVESGDWERHLGPWYDFINSHGGFQALKFDFSNYPPAYLYLILVATWLPVPKLYALKLMSIIFDFVLAAFAYRAVKFKYPVGAWAASAFAIVFLLPTVMIDSAVWAQCDSIYVSFLLGCVYYLMKKKPIEAMIVFGLAFSFKLQAIFLLPMLLALLIKGELRISRFLIFPLIYILTIVPNVFAGKPFVDLLFFYQNQAESHTTLVLNAPNIYQWLRNLRYDGFGGVIVIIGCIVVIAFVIFGFRRFIETIRSVDRIGKVSLIILLLGPAFMLLRPFVDLIFMVTHHRDAFSVLKTDFPSLYESIVTGVGNEFGMIGVYAGFLAVAALCYLVFRTRKKIIGNPMLTVQLALVSVLMLPFLLVRMHERYFFPADIIAIVYAFYQPKRFFVPIAIVSISLLSYCPYLLGKEIVSLAYLAVGLSIIIILTVCDFVKAINEKG